MPNLAFGCSHTFGIGVEQKQAWPALLNLKNYGAPGVSADYIVRIIGDAIKENNPNKIYILWPDWTRFEYKVNDTYHQSRPTDKNRILFMEEWTDEKLFAHFNNNVTIIKNICDNEQIKLVHMTLDDLVPIIDHADKWPLSTLGHHYSPVWHRWVADIFLAKEHEQT